MHAVGVQYSGGFMIQVVSYHDYDACSGCSVQWCGFMIHVVSYHDHDTCGELS